MTEQVSMLIVDDEPSVRDSLLQWFLQEGFRVETAADATEALRKMGDFNFDIALLDIKMPGMDGIELQGRLKQIDSQLVVIIMTAYASVDTAIQALKQGAYDYITKPVDPDDLSRLIRNASMQRRLLRENLSLKEEIRSLISTELIIGKTPRMLEVDEAIRRVAPTEVTVMIQGASGTGRELVARTIHLNSKRKYFPFITLNCGTLTEALTESELFGHEQGAFTGALFRRKGKLELADKGALFLDEIGSIGPRAQADLLRVLETNRFTRLGGSEIVEADFRIISATSKNLEEAVKEGRFSEDLYYRLNVFNISLPSLKERASDIPLLAEHFLRKFASAMNKPFTGIEPGAMELLKQKETWPGNVRELQNAVERAVVVGRPPLITASDFAGLLASEEASTQEGVLPLAEMEKRHIQLALDRSGGDVLLAARMLEIDEAAVYDKIRKYGLA
ncbi:MAG: sigma-54-dependent transcriptional regulator [Syntrophobacteraceae bacterium]